MCVCPLYACGGQSSLFINIKGSLLPLKIQFGSLGSYTIAFTCYAVSPAQSSIFIQTQVFRLAQQALYILRHLPSPLWLWFNEWLCEGHSSNTTGIIFLLASLDVDKRLSSICLSAITVTAFPSTVPNIPWLRTANSLARFACKSCLYVWQKLLQIGKCTLSKQNKYHQLRNPWCDWCLDRVDEGKERPVDSIQVWC